VIAREDITGLVLAGGQGSRMGGLDKGLQAYRGRTLVAHALRRLAPQVGPLLVSANRHVDRYAVLGVPVWPDAPSPAEAGPLAGLLAGLDHCATPYLAAVPCDAPNLPCDLVLRLSAAIESTQADLAIATTQGGERPHPVFCLVPVRLRDDLERHLHQGGRKVLTWMRSHRCAEAAFDDARAFANLNTLADLELPDAVG
jgi:molybdopterin-guanine dinucleotide biosynthesis protein A